MRKEPTNQRYIYSSLTRIADLGKFYVKKLEISEWENGDFVVGKVLDSNTSNYKLELANGRMMELMEDEHIVGVLGIRHATLEVTGSYKLVGQDHIMQLLTGAGLMGKLTSKSTFIPHLIDLMYLGHIMLNGRDTNMADYVPKTGPNQYNIPTILIVGTSMSAGKTTSARVVIKQLRELGLKVTGAKLTGAGRLRDILAMKDAGADHVLDFVDAGLPSSICPPSQFEKSLQTMLSLIMDSSPDVAVVEIGASPLEPYNGDLAIESIRDQVKCVILCASDPYAVLGVMKSFDLEPTLVSGPASNTLGGIELIKNLTGVKAFSLIDSKNHQDLRSILIDKLVLPSSGS